MLNGMKLAAKADEEVGLVVRNTLAVGGLSHVK